MRVEPIVNIDIVSDALSVAQAFSPLSALRSNYLSELLSRSQIEYLCAGQALFERGVYDRYHFYLISGQVRLEHASGYVEAVRAGEQVGPIANELPRPCRAIAVEDCTLLRVDSERLDLTLSWSEIAEYLLTELSHKRDLDEDMDWIVTVLNSNLFFKVPPVNADRILSRMIPQVVMAGEAIVRQGEIGSCCYFIKEGTARVTRHEAGGANCHLADIGVGRCFGEDALVYETLRNATVTMSSDGVLMRLEKEDFKLLLVEPEVEEVSEAEVDGLLQPPVFIDVRTEREYEQGHLALAINIPLGLLSLKKRLLRPDTPYIFYCDTGRRSRAAAFLLGKQGLNTFSLRGGLLGAGMQYQLVTDAGYILRNGEVIAG